MSRKGNEINLLSLSTLTFVRQFRVYSTFPSRRNTYNVVQSSGDTVFFFLSIFPLSRKTIPTSRVPSSTDVQSITHGCIVTCVSRTEMRQYVSLRCCRNDQVSVVTECVLAYMEWEEERVTLGDLYCEFWPRTC